MKQLSLYLPLFFISSFSYAQGVDSLAVSKEVDSLIQVSKTFTDQKDFEKALEANSIAEKLALEKLGPESAKYGIVCHNHGRVFLSSGDYANAEKKYLEALTVKGKALGKEHAELALTLNNLGILYEVKGDVGQAEQYYIQAIAMREKTLGKEHKDYAASLKNLATLKLRTNNARDAIEMFLEAASIQEKVLGAGHRDYFGTLNNLANCYWDIGDFKKAESLHLEILTARGNFLGKDHPDYVASLRNLGQIYRDINRYTEGEQYLLEAKTIVEKNQGRENEVYAGILGSLAYLYNSMEKTEEAEALFWEVLPLLEKLYGKDHSLYAGSLGNLGALYQGLGNYAKAESLHLEVKDIFERSVGTDDPSFISAVNNLGVLYHEMGAFEKAVQFYEVALIKREKLLGPTHPHYAYSLCNLGMIYVRLGDFTKADSLLHLGKIIIENTLGKESIEYIWTLVAMGTLCQQTAQYDKAENLYREALTFIEKTHGKNSMTDLNSLHQLATLYWETQRPKDAAHLFKTSGEILQGYLVAATRHLSERELASYINTQTSRLFQYYSFAQTHQFLIDIAYDNALFYKGLLLHNNQQIRNRVSADTSLLNKFDTFQSLHKDLAIEYAKPLAMRDSAALVALEEKANNLEKELIRKVAGFGDATRIIKWQDVQANLKPGEAALEFVWYKFSNPEPTDSVMYAAILLSSGAESPKFIPLFEEKQLDSLLHTKGGRKADYVNGLYTIADRGINPVETPQKSLYELLWMPIEQELQAVRTIYLSPDGLLHRLNFNAIPKLDETTLADHYHLVGLASTRQLVTHASTNNTNKDALLFGGVQYDIDWSAPSLVSTGVSGFGADLSSRSELSFGYADSTNRKGSWSYLKWTEKEIATLEPVLKKGGFNPFVYRGEDASETSFKSIGKGKASPRVLHIATHGFFFPDPKSITNHQNNETVFRVSEHPMIRSGLILAGANHAWKTGKPFKPGMEDGILTAYEISQMDLSSTELVVLSACETGLGDILGNEGVYGLQRAFKIAGAKYLVMSLWQVPDQETSVFMTTFYRHWLEGKKSIPDAFQTTQQEMRERFINPYQWAGFVLVE